MKIIGIIPARYASQRFPGKALINMKGKSMIQRVYEGASKAKCLEKVVVATDHPKIIETVEGFGGVACMTSESHRSGTDRCREALDLEVQSYDYVINIQGDEPFIQAEQIEQLANVLNESSPQIATLVLPIRTKEHLFDPNVVKVVVDHENHALYFSRLPIPYLRGVKEESWLNYHTYFKHIGIYAYQVDVLRSITALKSSSLEKAEALEQLRWVQKGYRIKVGVTTYDSHGVDTPEDLRKLLQKII